MELKRVRYQSGHSFQRGAVGIMLALALVLLVSAGAAVRYAGAAQWSVEDSIAAEQLARQARDVVMAFSGRSGRLPCPASVQGGEEDCGGQRTKGYLPVLTLWPAGPAELRDSFRDVRYGVYRGPNDSDLASLVETFTPTGFHSPDLATYPAVLHSGWDWCRKLGKISANGVTSDTSWQRAGERNPPDGNPADDRRTGYRPLLAGRPVRNVAFALAVPQAGAPRSYSGVNADDTPLFEDPDRPNNDEYRDSVEAVSFDEAFEGARCRVGLMAMDTMHSERFRTDTLRGRVEGLGPYAEFFRDATALHVTADVINIGATAVEGLALAVNEAGALAEILPPLKIAEMAQNKITEGLLVGDIATAGAGIGASIAHAQAYLNAASTLALEIRPWYDIEQFVLAADKLGPSFELR